MDVIVNGKNIIRRWAIRIKNRISYAYAINFRDRTTIPRDMSQKLNLTRDTTRCLNRTIFIYDRVD